MAAVETTEKSASRGLWGRYGEITRDVKRGFVAEWNADVG